MAKNHSISSHFEAYETSQRFTTTKKIEKIESKTTKSKKFREKSAGVITESIYQ